MRDRVDGPHQQKAESAELLWKEMGRRSFLIRSLTLFGALWISPRRLWAVGLPSVLRERHRKIFESIAEAYLPEGGELEFSATTLNAGEKFIEIVSAMPEKIQRVIGWFVWAFDHQTWIRLRFKKFSHMALGERQERLAALMNSEHAVGRAFFIFMKQFVMMATYSNPATYPGIGYDPLCR